MKGIVTKMNRTRIKNIILSILCITFSAVFAILVHALMPSPGATLNVDSFDSVLVKQFGFPIVACMYFLLLYFDIFIVIYFFGKQSTMVSTELGLRYSLVFSLIYIIGMQEIVVEASPFTEWGAGFVLYQLCMGLGDAIPAIAMCMLITKVFFSKRKFQYMKGLSRKGKDIVCVIIFTCSIFVARVVGYVTGSIQSDIQIYPIPTLIWTGIFGIIIGLSYVILAPIYQRKVVFRITILTVGVNWIIFNSFIGMIFADTIKVMLRRSIIDVITIYLTGIFVNHFIINDETRRLNRIILNENSRI